MMMMEMMMTRMMTVAESLSTKMMMLMLLLLLLRVDARAPSVDAARGHHWWSIDAGSVKYVCVIISHSCVQ